MNTSSPPLIRWTKGCGLSTPSMNIGPATQCVTLNTPVKTVKFFLKNIHHMLHLIFVADKLFGGEIQMVLNQQVLHQGKFKSSNMRVQLAVLEYLFGRPIG